MKITRFLIIVSLLAVLLYGCASTAPSSFYTLNATAQPGTVKFSHTVSSVGPVLIPPILDRPQIVTRITPNQVEISEFHRWAVPLSKDIAQVLAESLMFQISPPRVPVFPPSAPEEDAYRVAIDIADLEAVSGREVSLDAYWSIRNPENSRTVTGRTTRIEPMSGPGYDAQITAYNRVLEKLSKDISAALVTF